LFRFSAQFQGGGTVHFRRIISKLTVILSLKRNAKRLNHLR